jgi:hypothetical protein
MESGMGRRRKNTPDRYNRPTLSILKDHHFERRSALGSQSPSPGFPGTPYIQRIGAWTVSGLGQGARSRLCGVH